MSMEVVDLNGVDLDEIRVAVNNLGMKVMLFTETRGNEPEVVILGTVPKSEAPLISFSLHLYTDKKGNKCPILCGVISDPGDNTTYVVELSIDPRHLGLFLDSVMRVTFCERVNGVEGSEILCENAKSFTLIGNTDREAVEELVREIENPGDISEAWADYIRKHENPICLTANTSKK